MADQPPEPSSTPSSQQRTFKLYEFICAFGRDAHHLVFIQQESNAEALTVFEENLRENIDYGSIRSFPRVYTETDLKNIQTSCLDILEVFSNTNDIVSFQVVLGKIEMQPRGSGSEGRWFDDAFHDDKDPSWAQGFNIELAQVVDLQTKTFK